MSGEPPNYPIIVRQPDGSLIARARSASSLPKDFAVTTATAGRILGLSQGHIERLCHVGRLKEGADWTRRETLRGKLGWFRIRLESVYRMMGRSLPSGEPAAKPLSDDLEANKVALRGVAGRDQGKLEGTR